MLIIKTKDDIEKLKRQVINHIQDYTSYYAGNDIEYDDNSDYYPVHDVSDNIELFFDMLYDKIKMDESYPNIDIVNYRNDIIKDLNNTKDRYNAYQIMNTKGLSDLEYVPIDTVYEIIDKRFDEYIKNKEKV